MLNGRRDDVFSGATVSHGRSNEGPVIALRSAGGKKDLFFIDFQGLRDDLPALPEVLLRFHSFCMLGGRVSVILHHCLYHHITHMLSTPGCGGIVQICFQNFYLLPGFQFSSS